MAKTSQRTRLARRRAFGLRVRSLREQRDWSQEEIAARAGVHRTGQGGVERGERNVSLDNIGKLADALGIPISERFQPGEGRPRPSRSPPAPPSAARPPRE